MKHIAQHMENSGAVIEYGGYSFLYIRNLSAINVARIANFDGVIIEAINNDFVRLVVHCIRGNNEPKIYLKPLFLTCLAPFEDLEMERLVDGQIKGVDKLEIILPKLERILFRAKEVAFTNSISFEAQILTKLISFLYVKEEKRMKPIPSVHSSLNYTYPFLSVNFEPKELHTALKILQLAENEGLLRSDYFDRIYLCASCSGGHLSYREVCPKCSSSNAIPDDIVHHFPCGYVGPMKDYKNEIDDKLDCPKCNKRLKHIGVDYDKPSLIYDCNNCNHKFQDYHVNAKCLSCHSDKAVEHLKPMDIKSYRLTKKGELAAVKGLVIVSKDIEEVVGTIKYDTFKTMLKYEIERLKETEGISSLCAIHIGNSSHVYSTLGSESQRTLLKDIITVIRGSIRSSDIITFESAAIIVLSMSNKSPREAQDRLSEVINTLQDLIKTSFNNLEIAFEVTAKGIDFSKTHEVLLQELLTEFN